METQTEIKTETEQPNPLITHTVNDGHRHQNDGLIQHVVLDPTGRPMYTEVEGRRVKFVPRILGFEKYCLLCGLVEHAIEIGRIVT